MDSTERIIEQLVVTPGTRAAIADRDPGWSGGPDYERFSQKELKAEAKAVLAQGVEDLSKAQELLWASDTYALLVVLQAMDAAGKDSAIQHVMTGVNPQGVQVVSFRAPSSEELDHNFLWRISKALPERGRIGIFNRSHYEEVVALRVHPEWLGRQRLPTATDGPAGLVGTLRRHQRLRAGPRPERDEDRQAVPERLQGGAEAPLASSARYAQQRVEVRCGRRCRASSLGRLHVRLRGRAYGHLDAVGPVVRDPPGHKWLTQALVVRLLVETIRGLDLRWPEVSESERGANAEARGQLEAEG